MKRIYPWLMAGFILFLGIIQAIYSLQYDAAPVDYLNQFLVALNIGLIAFIGALIIDRQTRNRIGWLMMGVALITALPGLDIILGLFPKPPSALTPGIWLLLWFQSWTSWILPILIFHIMFNYPDGRLLSERWKWIYPVTFGTILVVALVWMFREQIGPVNGAWEVDNPLGFISQNLFEALSLLWVLGLAALGAGSLASLFIRFRRGSYVEREQIKWLFFAGALLILTIGLFLAAFTVSNDSPVWLDILFPIMLMIFPLSIANAILRYRLYDIDIIIRRTLQYTLLTGLLISLYFGGIVILQRILEPVLGEVNSPLITVITTLGIASLFNPIRIRVQDIIDRRFFRTKYDAEKALKRFAVLSRDEVDIERLSDELLTLIDETMKPDHVSLWLRQEQVQVWESIENNER